jgi:iron complex outermembrane receptor protein
MKRAILRSASGLAIAMLVAGATHAQDAGAEGEEETRRLDRIVVTAQKTEQSLQDVPVAVSVLGAEAIDNAFASNNLESLTTLLPSVGFRKGSTNANSAIIVRGIGTVSFSDAAEPSVATVVDGVVLGRSGQTFGDLFDIERIEVLRGPQGTLFGKNASAGVINIITQKPDHEEWGGYVSASYFQDEEYQVKGRISGPITDTVAASLTVTRSEFDGFIRNLFNNRDVNGYDRWGGRLQVSWKPSDDFRALFTYEHNESDDDCCADIPALAANDGRFADSLAPPGGLGIVPGAAGERPFADIQLDTRVIDQDFETRTINNFDAFSVNLEKDIWGDHTITSITSFREWSNTEFREGDFTSTGGLSDQPVFGVPFLLHDVGTRDNSQFSQEVRFQSSGEGRLNYNLGLYYFDLQIESDFTRDASCQNNGGQNQDILDANPGLTCNANDIVSATNFANVDFDNYAIFGNIDYDVLDGLNLFFGARWTRDEVDFINSRVNNDPFGRQGVGVRPDQPNSQFGLASGGFALPNAALGLPALSGDTDENDFSVRAGVNADIGELLGNGANFGSTYFSFSQGYKGPAFNVFFNQGFNDTVPIGAETSDQFEIGYKLALPNSALNIALYTSDISGFQANAFDTSTGVTITRLTNAGDVRTRGIEIDGTWLPTDWLSLTGCIALNDAEIRAFNSPLDPTGLAEFPGGIFTGQDLQFSPDVNYTFGANVNYPITDDYDFLLNTTFSHTDEQESLLPGGNPDPAVNPFPIPPQSLLPDYNLWDLSFGVRYQDRYTATFIVKNLLDESFVTTNSGDTFRFQIPREADRYVGVNFRAEF